MLPSFSDVYRSYYLQNTYVQATEIVNNEKLEDGYTILEPIQRIKPKFINDQCEYSSTQSWDPISRYQMGKRIMAIAKEIGIKVEIPQEKVVSTDKAIEVDGSIHDIIAMKPAERLKLAKDLSSRTAALASRPIQYVPTVDESIKRIRAMQTAEKIKLAQDLALLIKKVGLVEATLDNIRIRKDGTILILNVDPHGLIGKKPQSIEKCARLGLYTLFNSIKNVVSETKLEFHPDAPKVITNLLDSRNNLVNAINGIFNPMMDKTENGLQIFAETIQNEYMQSLKPIEKKKAFLPLRPFLAIVNAIRAFIKKKQIEGAFKSIIQVHQSYGKIIEPIKEFQDKEKMESLRKEYLEKIAPLSQKYLELRENIYFDGFNDIRKIESKEGAVMRFASESLFRIYEL